MTGDQCIRFLNNHGVAARLAKSGRVVLTPRHLVTVEMRTMVEKNKPRVVEELKRYPAGTAVARDWQVFPRTKDERGELEPRRPRVLVNRRVWGRWRGS